MAESAAANAELQDEYGFSRAQIANFREAFNTFDKDGDGTVSVKELRNVFISVGVELSEDQCAKLVEQVDVDGSGTMGLSEFCILMAKTGLVPPFFGFEAHVSLRRSAASFEGSKLAKRKHQIGTLLFNARMQELEQLEKRTAGQKSKAETAAKYGW
ncbi:putative calmodulin-like protein 2 [Tetrabaena socialis]|uniref:Putative calmodulin-like protein 2 n=1 Tax=Tetrabaena socialis TaxID=47790 RepID=A0A2J7ZUU5_9CHLO|nr:putative calmodulin-like protein 2 [Tetrabaena socialis]|eukprot:PNH04046.1 putative calmodulin-like protein 2 [Tetrabaena socialis]